MIDRQNIVLFDGVCNLCNASVNFIIDRDKKSIFYFSALQSEFGKRIVKDKGIKSTDSTFIYLEKDIVYSESTAALKVLRKLNGLWPMLYVFIIIPRFIRNPIYRFIAKNRYKWFGVRSTCRLSQKGLEQRFID